MNSILKTSSFGALLCSALLASHAFAASGKEQGEETIRATVVEVDNTPGHGTVTMVADDGRTLILPQVPLKSAQYVPGTVYSIGTRCTWSRLYGLRCQTQGWQSE
jgi:hypothetical protein